MSRGERYERLTENLEAVGAQAGTAEAQGMLVGMLTGASDTSQARWIAEVLADTEPRGEAARACLEDLALLYDETAAALADEELTFEPLLPTEEAALPERARALAGWCGGFLFGIGYTELGEDASLPGQVREALTDLAEIARVAAEPEEGEEDEESYAELLEYVRVAVLLCREHLSHPTMGAEPQ